MKRNDYLFLGVTLLLIGIAGLLSTVQAVEAEPIDNVTVEWKQPDYTLCEYCLATKMFSLDFVPKTPTYKINETDGNCAAIIYGKSTTYTYTCVDMYMKPAIEEYYEK